MAVQSDRIHAVAAGREGRTKIIRSRRWAVATLICAMLTAGIVWNQTNDNFHEVQAGVCFRSAQPSARDLARYSRKYNIRSVVNLRGASPGRRWYERETDAARELGLSHYDLRLPTDAGPDQTTLNRLIRIFQDAPRPILIHCRRGADRTGLAAGIWKLAIQNGSRDEAMGQLSIRYGHVPLLGRQELDRFLQNWVPSEAAVETEEGSTPAAIR